MMETLMINAVPSSTFNVHLGCQKNVSSCTSDRICAGSFENIYLHHSAYGRSVRSCPNLAVMYHCAARLSGILRSGQRQNKQMRTFW